MTSQYPTEEATLRTINKYLLFFYPTLEKQEAVLTSACGDTETLWYDGQAHAKPQTAQLQMKTVLRMSTTLDRQ